MRWADSREFERFVEEVFTNTQFNDAPHKSKKLLVLKVLNDPKRSDRILIALVSTLNMATIDKVLKSKISSHKKINSLETLQSAFSEEFYEDNGRAATIFNRRRNIFEVAKRRIGKEILNLKSKQKGSNTTKTETAISRDSELYSKLIFEIQSGRHKNKTLAVRAASIKLNISESKCWKVLAARK